MLKIKLKGKIKNKVINQKVEGITDIIYYKKKHT